MIVNEFINFNTPDAFVKEAEPQASIRGTSIGVVGAVVQAIRGAVGVPTLVSDLNDYIRKFGGWDTAINADYMFMENLFKNGASEVKVVRVTDGNERAATGVVSATTYRVLTPGTWGNSVKLVVTASSVSGYVDLNFSYGAENYTYSQVTFTSSADARYAPTIIGMSSDGFVEVVTAGASNPAPGTTTFTGGTNGTQVGTSAADTIYVGANGAAGLTGLVALEADDEVEIVAAARATTTVNDAVRDHVGLTTVTPRMGIVAPAVGTQVAGVVTMMATYNSDRVVVTYPHMQVLNKYNNKKELHTPTAFYAGVLAKLNYHQSPSRQQVIGVIATERALTRAEVDTLSKNRVSSITVLNGQGFVIRNGYNTSSVPSKQNITRRRAVNYFVKTFEVGSQQFVSKPHTDALRSDIKSAFGSLLQTEQNLGRIGGVNGGKAFGIKCDAQNNPIESVRQGKLIVDVQISLLAPADFILITLDASEAKVVTVD